MEILASNEWYEVLDVIRKEKGTVILLGATDAGKTTLAKFLIAQLSTRKIKVAFVDADIGQSYIGPPTTIGLVLFESPPDLENIQPREIFFIGATTPEENLPLHLRGVRRMVDKAITYGPEVVLVDTTGLVSGEVGIELKIRKINLLAPCSILVLQRFEELEDILALIKGNPLLKIHRLPVSEEAQSRSKEVRRLYRTRKYQEYFKGSQIKDVMIKGIQLEGIVHDPNGQPVLLERALRVKGLLSGFKTINEDTLALGVMRDFLEEQRTLRVSTPLNDFGKVKSIQLCSVRLSPSYEEERIA
jgi:polynucleotide 5'-hydroxyl-kinase GRC3/NOL9